MPEQMTSTFSGHAGVGAVTSISSHMAGGYIVKVVMEDIDPVNGAILGGTIAMVEMEDVDTNVNNDAITTAKALSTTMTIFMQKLRRKILLRKRTTQSRTNTALENALKVLHRVDLNDMADASDTIQKLTNDSRECCARCVEVPVSQLIYNVVLRMSCQSFNPVILHNLLLSLGNLARYRHWKQQTRPFDSRFEWSRKHLDSRLIEMLGEMLLVLSDDLKPRQQQSWSLFTTAAGTLWDLVMLARSSRSSSLSTEESWIATHQRLIDLRDRLHKRKQSDAAKRHTDQDLLADYLTNAVGLLDQISSLMSASFQYHF
ncbi:hypothetical protein PHMEG_00034338 [Phytophthora megakarya]|uniref:Uncharacterized protein n=1 Tax=Phytophthora megakarya TaxID=4795 RepID=A0A225URM6_9STRA|nr:hypothetical protein PHMEG_00034338 [Phytophthora megakarya]